MAFTGSSPTLAHDRASRYTTCAAASASPAPGQLLQVPASVCCEPRYSTNQTSMRYATSQRAPERCVSHADLQVVASVHSWRVFPVSQASTKNNRLASHSHHAVAGTMRPQRQSNQAAKVGHARERLRHGKNRLARR